MKRHNGEMLPAFFDDCRSGRWLLKLFMLACSLWPYTAQAQLCPRWGEPFAVGGLEVAYLPEASGLAVSRRFENTLYHLNDSGYGPYVYVTDAVGENTRRVRIENFVMPRHDPEDLALGPCDGGQSCLFIGDIGDNLAQRDGIFVYVLKEVAFGASAEPYRRLELRYPGGPRDAEALAVHPSGDLYILSKAWRFFPFLADPARLYRLERPRWEDAPNGVHTLTFVGLIDLPAINRGRTTPLGHVATAMDFSPDGERLLVLTYENALEFQLDLALGLPDTFIEGQHYRAIPLRTLPQQEAVAYLPDGRNFLYSSEVREPFSEAELVRVNCLD